MTLLNADKVLVEKYAADFSIPREIAEIMARRFPEYGEAKRFLFPDVSQLHDPASLPDITRAAQEISQAVRKGEGILIYTHDDVDGYTSAAIMYKALDDMKRVDGSIHLYPLIREQDGYVLNPAILRRYHEKGVRFLLSVDFGISSEENERVAEQEGMQYVICDHHETERTRFTVAAVDPKRTDSRYPYRELAGVGVAFKLAQFLYHDVFRMDAAEFYRLKKDFFPIVCIGTLADRVPLNGENRVFCRNGMRLLLESKEPWAVELRQGGLLDINRVLREVLPAIGSAAYADPNLGIDLFIERDAERVKDCYERLRQTDQKRREEIDSLFSTVLVEAKVNSRTVLSLVPLSKHHYLGSIAARLRDYYKRNSLIIGMTDEKCVGELRSCDTDLHRLLNSMRGFFIEFGGHQKAAGFSMGRGNLDAFLNAFERYMTDTAPDIPNDCDGRTPEPEAHLRRSDVGMLDMLLPFGDGNKPPVLTDGVSCYTVDNSLNLLEKS